jgi:hypothetical protein
VRGRVLAHRWPATVIAAVLIATIGAVSHGSSLQLPFTDSPVPLSSVTIIGASVIAAIPLISAVPELERTLSRERGLRGLRVSLAVGLVAGAMTVAWAAEGNGLSWVLRREAPFSMVLVCVAIVAVVAVGDAAWLVPLTVGYLGLIIDSTLTAPITTALARVPPAAFVIALLLVAGAYVWRGPRLPS